MFDTIVGVEYNVLVSVDDASKGMATLRQPVLCGTTEAVIDATPHWGYTFTQWSDGYMWNYRTVTVTCDTTFTAMFAPDVFHVYLSTNDPTGGSVTGEGSYEYGDTATLIATPNEGYRFMQWSDGNTDNPRTLTMTKDVELSAEFAPTMTTGLDDTVRLLAVTTEHCNILVYGAADNTISAYTMQGVCLYRGSAEAEPAIIPVPSAGLYVVMVGEEMVKVVVR